MRLYIDVFTAKQLLCSLSCEFLYHVHAVTAAIITVRRITLCIFIRQNASHSGHDRMADPVLRRDQLDVAVLSVKFSGNRVCDLSINCFYIF